MSTYTNTLDWLYGLQKFGIKLGLDNIRALLDGWGNPQDMYPAIHVAGTNGKGSTAAFLASILTEAGYRTGLYTSPHLEDFSERIRIDGVPISGENIVRYAGELREEVDRSSATFFEATTAMAFLYFADQRIDVAVIETGLGGRLDSTNVLRPRVSVITGVALEHTEILGNNIAEIASEKAGIIKPEAPVVIGPVPPEARAVFARAAAVCGVQLHDVSVDPATIVLRDLDATECSLLWNRRPVTLVLPLAGAHQAGNAALAVRAAELFGGDRHSRIVIRHVVAGIANMRRNSGLRGRLQRLQSVPEIVIDVAHNPDGVRALLASWKAVRDPAHTHLVFGLLKTKDAASVLAEIAAVPWASITAVDAPTEDGRKAAELRILAESAGLPIRTFGSALAAVDQLQIMMAAGDSILLFGSHYVVGDYLAERKKRNPFLLDL